MITDIFEHVITYCFNWESFLCQRRPRRAMPCTTMVQHIDGILLSPDFRTLPPILIPAAAAASVLHNGLLCCCIFIFHVGFAVHLMQPNTTMTVAKYTNIYLYIYDSTQCIGTAPAYAVLLFLDECHVIVCWFSAPHAAGCCHAMVHFSSEC